MTEHFDEIEPWRTWVKERENKRCENCGWWKLSLFQTYRYCEMVDRLDTETKSHSAYLLYPDRNHLVTTPNFYCSEFKKKDENRQD